MVRSVASGFALVLLGSVVACSSTSSTPTDGGTTSDGGADVSTDASTSPVGLGFIPSNLATVDLSGDLPDLELRDCGAQIRAAETGRLACFDPTGDKPYRYVEIEQPGGTKVKVFVVRSLRIPTGVVAPVLASDPVAIIALDKIEIEGSLVVAPGESGGFKAPDSGVGNGPGGGKPASSGSGDGGGSYCGIGGTGGSATAGAGGAAYGNAQIVPLLPGSSGGGMFAAAGGGAIQLVAKNLIRVGPGGSINAGGGGSDQGGAGSGGAILLEAADVQVLGKIAANGGGGGAGTGAADGKDGLLDDQPTPAGVGDPTAGGGGGAGGAGMSVNGGPGVVNSSYPDGSFAGNGGGGAGRIRINTASGRATTSGLVSPSLTSNCSTQGVLAVEPK